MAVTTSITNMPVEYIMSGGNLPGCIGGGEDYRTLNGSNNDMIEEVLLIRGWAGDNISSACKITEITVSNLDTKVMSTTSGVITIRSFKLIYGMLSFYGSVSGTTFNSTHQKLFNAIGDYIINNSNSWRTFSGFSKNVESQHETYPDEFIANKSYIGLRLQMWRNGYNVRAYFKNLKLSVTRTRACYITFNGDGITATTTMYDYGSTPSFGSTPTRSGYIFKGWKSSVDGVVYTGTLPTAYENDVTYTAQWTESKTNKIYIGTSQPSKIYVGTSEVKAVYVGTTKVYG